MTAWAERMSREGHSIGFVPTMGALHEGHRSLIYRALSENDRVVLSIFVNPTQFNDPADLERYPHTFKSDLEMIDDAGVDALLFADFKELYPDDYRFRVTENSLSSILEGEHRAGHFDGVLTIVLKLLGILRPDRAYFGEKDWQQYLLIRDMARAFFLRTEILPCPTIREADGLAMSSRNALLSKEERRLAPELHHILSSGDPISRMLEKLRDAGFDVDYLENFEGRLLAAVHLGKTRLIDNVQV